MPEEIKVLDHGFVKHVETWGSDERIIEAARMSTQGGFVSWDPYEGHLKGDAGLLAYLWKNNHATPFEMGGLTIEVQAPIFVFREWHRHRTQCVSGNTLIHFDAPKSRENRRFVYKMRIEDVWRKWQPTVRGSRPERQTNRFFPRSRIQAMLLRCLNEEQKEFSHTTITDAIRGEPKEMVRVTVESGRMIELTRDHRVLTSEGWMRMGEALDRGALLTLEGTTRAKAQRWERPPPDEGSEEWRAAPGWEGFYEVSTEGRVRRIGCEPKKATTTGHSGYDVVSLTRGEEKRVCTVHSLVLAAFKGPRPEGQEARHLNHNRADARLSNLEWGTAAKNARDRVEADRNQRLVPVFEEIAEVTKLGMVPTYDLTVEGPWHNFVADGFVVHNSYNEASARYAPLPDLNYVPTLERVMMGAGGTNKQAGTVEGSRALDEVTAKAWIRKLQDRYDLAQRDYELALESGVPKELARVLLPVGRYSRMRASANLRNWLGFLKLRLDPKAQFEIRAYAAAVNELVAAAFPRTHGLFCGLAA